LNSNRLVPLNLATWAPMTWNTCLVFMRVAARHTFVSCTQQPVPYDSTIWYEVTHDRPTAG
jgi:hypothetical protein